MTIRATIGTIAIVFVRLPLSAQNQFDSFQRDRERQMLRDLQDGLKKHYYDASYHGVDMDARFKDADEKIQKSANLGQALTVIGASLDALNDSHTFFEPPPRTTRRSTATCRK